MVTCIDGQGVTDLFSSARPTHTTLQKSKRHPHVFNANFSIEIFCTKALQLDDRFCIFGKGVIMVLDLAISASAEAAHELECGTTLSLVASMTTRESWTASRRRHHAHGSRAKRGLADGTLRTLEVCRGLTLVCLRCGSLVHWMAALSRASKCNREEFAPGDGCSNRGCSLNHRPAQYCTGQLAMATGLKRPVLAQGARYLIEWPAGRSARIVYIQPRACAVAEASNARQRALRMAGGGETQGQQTAHAVDKEATTAPAAPLRHHSAAIHPLPHRRIHRLS